MQPLDWTMVPAMTSGLSAINRAFNRVPKRAEARQADQLRDTFEDSGVSAALEAIDHQVLYGRRGTGKTHALRYLEGRIQASGDIAVYLDLRTVGSPEGLYLGEQVEATERAARLLVDLLMQFHDAVLESALSDDGLVADTQFVNRMDALADSVSTLRVAGELEVEVEQGERHAATDTAGFAVEVSGVPRASAAVASGAERETSGRRRETRSGRERLALNFSDVARALRNVAHSIGARRIWVLLDEWSSIPSDVQPLLGEFLVRCVLPLQAQMTVKIGAIELQSRFRERLPSGQQIGIELGADVSANVDLDHYMVFEQNETRARNFFRGLLYKHLLQDQDAPSLGLRSETDFVRVGFTDKRALDELVRAAEGVPRDAINILGKAALTAGSGKISVPNVRAASASWFQTDKEGALRARPEAQDLLNWIIDEVIREKRSRGFLVNQRSSDNDLLMALFDARVLHLVRRGYSAQDEPGERYNVYLIDYGAYVDLIHTQSEPEGMLPLVGGGFVDRGELVDVPTQDLRSLRRAILDLEQFAARN